MSKIEESTEKQETCLGDRNPEIVFYVIRRNGDKIGLLSFFNTHLGHINYAVSQGYVPIVDMKNYKNIYLEDNEVGFKNSWEYFFTQPYGETYTLEEVYQSKRVIFSSMEPKSPRPDDDMDFLMNDRAQRYVIALSGEELAVLWLCMSWVKDLNTQNFLIMDGTELQNTRMWLSELYRFNF
jgi:hypothetical protein